MIQDNTTQDKNEGFEIEGDWTSQSKQLQVEFSQLTDEDLQLEAGKTDEMLERVGTRLNMNREEVVNVIKKGQPVKS